MNYSELVERIQDTAESSEATFVSNINQFIIDAENKVFISMKSPFFWKENLAVSFPALGHNVLLPTGAIDVVSIYIIGPNSSTDGQHLIRKDRSFLNEFMPVKSGSSNTGMPRFYCTVALSFSGSDPVKLIRVMPAPDIGYTAEMSYYGKITTDSITNGNTPGAPSTTVTWLSVSFPDVLFYGAMVGASIFNREEPDVVAMHREAFNEGLTLLKNMTEARMSGDEYSSLGKVDSAL